MQTTLLMTDSQIAHLSSKGLVPVDVKPSEVVTDMKDVTIELSTSKEATQLFFAGVAIGIHQRENRA